MDGLVVIAACLLLGIAAVVLYISDVSILPRRPRRSAVRPRLQGQPRGPPPPLRRRKVPARGRSDANRAPTPGRHSMLPRALAWFQRIAAVG